MQQNNAVVTLGGVRFRIEKVSDTYTIAVPVDDPQWMMRYLVDHHWKQIEMKLSEEQLEMLIANQAQFQTAMQIQSSLENEKEAIVATVYEKLRLSVPGMTMNDVRGFLERPLEFPDDTNDQSGENRLGIST